MKFSLALSALSTLRAAQALVVPAAESSNFVLPESIQDFYWEVETNVPGAAPLEVDGTIEKLHAQLSAINPNYLQEFNITTIFLPDRDTDAPVAVTTAPKHKRSENAVAVNQYKVDAIKDGIKYLRGLKGTARLGKGPNKCSRVSCSYSSGIHLCNDDPHYPKIIPWNDVADDAQRIIDGCPLDPRGWEITHPSRVTCKKGLPGVVKHVDARWSVRVEENDC